MGCPRSEIHRAASVRCCKRLGAELRFFGHYISRLFVLLAALDGVCFMTALRLLSLSPHCKVCYFSSVVKLGPLQAALLTSAFMVVTVSVGLYNADAFQNFRTFLKRFILAWQLIFIPMIAFVGITKATAGMPFGWYGGILSLATAIFMTVMFVLRVAMVWWFGQAYTKKRVVVLGSGRMAEAVTQFIKSSTRGRLQHVGTFQNCWGHNGHLQLH